MVNVSEGMTLTHHKLQMTKIQIQALKGEDLTQEERVWIAGEKEEQDIKKILRHFSSVIAGISLIIGMYGQAVPEPSFNSQIEVPTKFN